MVMKLYTRVIRTFIVWLLLIALVPVARSQSISSDIPDELKPWTGWVTWNDADRNSPAAYNNSEDRIRFWPSQLKLVADPTSGTWEIKVTTFSNAWVPLPGSGEIWPVNVRQDDQPVVVLERNGVPTTRLEPGQYRLSGEFEWDQLPQKILIPDQIGLLSLSIGDEEIPIPNRDEDGFVWLKRNRTDEAQKDLLAAQIYRVLEDGIPMWLRTDIELTVSGKSREEDLGSALPTGWRLATIDSPIPVAADEQGRLKAQVRAGKWTISLHAFRNDNPQRIQFAADAEPIIGSELVGFKAQPSFRLAQLEGMQKVDATQTTFPEKWRDLPVYQWSTDQSFQIVEKMRGMGLQRPEGLKVNRQLWLDVDGRAITYQDNVTGQMQRIWRLDSAEGHDLGAVRIDGQGQLITINPITKSPGVEIRQRTLSLEAVGRIAETTEVRATGWQSDVDSLNMTLTLPPGWRVLALFGPDIVQGDWLTAWSLLDLFLLLVFSLAVSRIVGWRAGIVAFIAFGLAYHEPGAPRYTWLFLLFPVALLKVIPPGTAKRWVLRWKYLAVALLAVCLVPFVARQVQNTLYPQLESTGVNYTSRGSFWFGAPQANVYQHHEAAVKTANVEFEQATDAELSDEGAELIVKGRGRVSSGTSFNLFYDPQAQIQTGPAIPDWSWNQVYCQWDGPVTAAESIRPVLISLTQHRILAIVRILFLLILATILIGRTKLRWPIGKRTRVSASSAVMCLLMLSPDQTAAQEFPPEHLLNTLRERLLEPNDAFPRAAEIPNVKLAIEAGRVSMSAEIHTELQVAVPLPGRLPNWSPVAVSVNDQPAELICRKDGYLWVVLPGGVHEVVVESMVPDVAEWNWTFLLTPRRVEINAPEWNVTGVAANGVPEAQVFFARIQQTASGEAAYDRKDFHVIVAVDRHIETGLIWQVRNELTRLSAPGRAVSLRIPLLEGERVLSSNVIVQDGYVEVRLGAGQEGFQWTSELPIGRDINLSAPKTEQWVERWHLLTSPVWNVAYTGLSPIFEVDEKKLIPVWKPWPGETTSLEFNKPFAISGPTITVKRVQHDITLSSRQRSTRVKVDIECSLGGDFAVTLPGDAEITSVEMDGQLIPPRRVDTDLIVPVHPGLQTVTIDWITDEVLGTVSGTEPVLLPVEGANISTVVHVPESRWVLWTAGPLRGPAVRFWAILIVAILVALVLGSSRLSPLNRTEWALLAIGLTQVHIVAAMFVVGWLFLLAYRGTQDSRRLPNWVFNLRQLGIVFVTIVSLIILLFAVGMGLLGHPDMFIVGNQSSRTYLQWFQPRGGLELPSVQVISVSVWYYRLLMLFWALWLAASLLRWLKWCWTQFSTDGMWKRAPTIIANAEETPSAG